MKKILAFGLIFLSLNASSLTDDSKFEIVKNSRDMTSLQFEEWVEENILGKRITSWTGEVEDVQKTFFRSSYYAKIDTFQSYISIELMDLKKDVAMSLKKGTEVTFEGTIEEVTYAFCSPICIEVNNVIFK